MKLDRCQIRSLAFVAFGLALTAVLHIFLQFPIGPTALIILVGWPLVGTIITIDDDLPGGWSNPDGTVRPPWKSAFFWADIVFRLALAFALCAIGEGKTSSAVIFWLLCVTAFLFLFGLLKRASK
jgi:hypothetical protein